MPPINRELLLKQLESVSPGLAKKEVVEQSSSFVFQDGLVQTFNGEVACTTKSPLKIKGAVAADPLLKLLHKLEEDSIDVSVDDGELIVKGKKRRSGVRMEEKVILPVEGIEDAKEWKPLHEDYLDALNVVWQCAGNDESQFVLTCVHIHSDHIEACDNFQTIRYPLETGIEQSALIRRESVKYISGLGMTEFSETDNWLHYRNPSGLVLSCRRWMEAYIDLGEVLQGEGDVVVLPKGLVEAVDKAEIFTSEMVDQSVMVELRDGRLELTGRGPSGWYQERKTVKWDGVPVKFGIAPRLLKEIVKRTNECRVCEGFLLVDGGGKFTCAFCTEVPEGD